MKLTTLVLSSLVVICLSSLIAYAVPIVSGPIVNPANSHLYYSVGPGSWTDCEATAVADLGGHLVTINDQPEKDWVLANFPLYIEVDHWIGLNDAAVEGTYEWVSGEPVTYLNWGAGEPNALVGEDYVNIFTGGAGPNAGKWNDTQNLDYGNTVYGIVEVVPEPATLGVLLVSAGLVLGLRRTR